MNTSLLFALCINAIPVLGVAFGNWNTATALALYWLENLVGSLLVAARIRLHQRLTQKMGHYRAQIHTTATTTTRSGKTICNSTVPSTYTAEFLIGSLIFTLAHGVFIAIMLVALKTPVERDALLAGGLGMAALQFLSFGWDARKLRSQSFAWVKRLGQQTFGRIVLVHCAIIAGTGLAAFSHNANFFLPFALFKLLADVLSRLGSDSRTDKAPDWMVRLANRLRPDGDFAAHLAQSHAQETAEATLDEQVRQAKPGCQRMGADKRR